jgi:hypothetical protein
MRDSVKNLTIEVLAMRDREPEAGVGGDLEMNAVHFDYADRGGCL